MDRQVLEEPLKEAREGYIKFLDVKRMGGRYFCVGEEGDN
jgi:hypothetical protein